MVESGWRGLVLVYSGSSHRWQPRYAPLQCKFKRIFANAAPTEAHFESLIRNNIIATTKWRRHLGRGGCRGGKMLKRVSSFLRNTRSSVFQPPPSPSRTSCPSRFGWLRTFAPLDSSSFQPFTPFNPSQLGNHFLGVKVDKHRLAARRKSTTTILTCTASPRYAFIVAV